MHILNDDNDSPLESSKNIGVCKAIIEYHLLQINNPNGDSMTNCIGSSTNGTMITAKDSNILKGISSTVINEFNNNKKKVKAQANNTSSNNDNLLVASFDHYTADEVSNKAKDAQLKINMKAKEKNVKNESKNEKR